MDWLRRAGIFLFNRWTEIEYDLTKVKIKKFPYLSNLVYGEGDKELHRSAPKSVWTKCIILKPTGANDVIIRPGFRSNAYVIAKVASSTRKVSDGSFAMRMGPDGCHFFVISTQEVQLEIVGYQDIIDLKVDLY